MKEHEQHEFERLKKLADALDRHPATIQQREKEAAETLAKRRQAAAKIEDLQLDFAACGVIQREIDDLVLNLAELDAKREKMKTVINEKVYFLAKEKSGLEGAMRHEQEILFNSYDPAINDAIDYFRRKLDWLRTPGRVTVAKAGSETNIYSMEKTSKIESNYKAVLDAMHFCQNAINTLEKMKLTPEFDLLEVEALKKNIPKIDVFNEFSDKKDISHDEPRPGYRKAIMEATGDLIDFSISRISEQVQKALKQSHAR